MVVLVPTPSWAQTFPSACAVNHSPPPDHLLPAHTLVCHSGTCWLSAGQHVPHPITLALVCTVATCFMGTFATAHALAQLLLVPVGLHWKSLI